MRSLESGKPQSCNKEKKSTRRGEKLKTGEMRSELDGGRGVCGQDGGARERCHATESRRGIEISNQEGDSGRIWVGGAQPIGGGGDCNFEKFRATTRSNFVPVQRTSLQWW